MYTAIFEQGPTFWEAYVPDLPGCSAAGKTRAEARQLITDAIEFHIKLLKKQGLPVPPAVSTAEVIGPRTLLARDMFLPT